MPAVAQLWQAEPRHPDQSLDIRLEDDALVFLRARVEGISAERQPGAVDEDVQAINDRFGDEALAARRIGDIELVSLDGRLDQVGAASTADHTGTFTSERPRGGGSDAARGARYDGDLSLQAGHSGGL